MTGVAAEEVIAGIPIQAVGGAGAIATLTLAIFAVARAIRGDSSKRMEGYANRIEGEIQSLTRRVDKTERKLARYQSRVYQLEAILRVAGIAIPPWTIDPADIDDPNIDALHDPPPVL